MESINRSLLFDMAVSKYGLHSSPTTTDNPINLDAMTTAMHADRLSDHFGRTLSRTGVTQSGNLRAQFEALRCHDYFVQRSYAAIVAL